MEMSAWARGQNTGLFLQQAQQTRDKTQRCTLPPNKQTKDKQKIQKTKNQAEKILLNRILFKNSI